MRLERWSLHFYRLPYAREVVWSNAVEDAGVFALLKLTSDQGLIGIAEGTVKATWSAVSPRSLAAALEDVLLPRVIGRDLDEVPQAFAGIPENRLAKALIDNACWTLRAAAAGKPLWRLWGGARRVELAWTVTRRAPALMAAEAQQVCARHGFRTLKVKGGQGRETDLAALEQIRAAVGAQVDLYVDANGAYPREEAHGYVRAIAAAGASVAEDPSPLAPDAEFEALQRGCDIPILVDASCASATDARLYLERGARALSAKPGRLGLSETRAVAALAARAHAKVAVGIYAESLLGTLVSLQLPGSMPAEQAFYLTMTDQVAALELPVAGGCVELPETADYASLVDWDKVKRFAL
jgi:L-alanine-DL-glutamate epimerase-like enolase superfamily enzyme